MGGKDAASARYIFTMPNPVTRTMFQEDDDPLLNYLVEEGQSIEPDYYLPILPLCLVNGAEGIGTGWSTYIPCYNPRDVVENLRRIMQGEPYKHMHPWFKGFQGELEELPGGKYNMRGMYEVVDEETLIITELPVGKWTREYKDFLETLA